MSRIGETGGGKTMPSATLDTNLLVEYWKDQAKAAVVKRLLEFAQNRHLDLAVTARIREDIPKPRLSDRIDELPELDVQEIGSVTRLGYWVLGRDMLGDDRFIAVADRLTEGFRRRSHEPPDWRDWDHIHAHYLVGRDAFLTWDKRILDVAPDLQDELGIVVMTPEDYLKDWDELAEPKTN